jgi:hypothetical protein
LELGAAVLASDAVAAGSDVAVLGKERSLDRRSRRRSHVCSRTQDCNSWCRVHILVGKYRMPLLLLVRAWPRETTN